MPHGWGKGLQKKRKMPKNNPHTHTFVLAWFEIPSPLFVHRQVCLSMEQGRISGCPSCTPLLLMPHVTMFWRTFGCQYKGTPEEGSESWFHKVFTEGINRSIHQTSGYYESEALKHINDCAFGSVKFSTSVSLECLNGNI